MRFRFFFSIQSKLLAFFLTLSLIPLILIGTLSYSQARQALEARIASEMERTARIQAARIDRLLAEYVKDAQLVADMKQVRSMNPADVHEAITSFAGRWTQYIVVTVFKTDGLPLTESDRTLEETAAAPISVLDRDYFQRGMQGGTISDVLLSRRGDGPVMVAAAPIVENGQVVGVVATVMTTEELSRLLHDAQIGQTGDVYMVNSAGYLITPPRFSQALKDQGLIQNRAELALRADSAGVREALAGRTGVSIYKDYRGQWVVGAYAPIPRQGWGLLVEQEVGEALAPVARLRRTAFLIGLVVAGLAIAAVLILARSITGNVTRLTRAAGALQAGDLTARAQVGSRDELGELAGVFNGMAARLQGALVSLQEEVAERKRAEQAVRSLNVTLEQQVADRTRELTALYQQTAVRQERLRIARDLHAAVTQSLYGLVALTEAGQAHLADGDVPGAGTADALRHTLAFAGETARQALKEMRLFIHQLRPPTLEREGLVAALHQRLAAVEGWTNVQAHLLADELTRLPLPLEMALYQVAQEALNNALRHAHATVVDVRVRSQDGCVILEIVDDGCGFDPERTSGGGMGLANMRKRAEDVGGALEITSRLGEGTQVRVVV